MPSCYLPHSRPPRLMNTTSPITPGYPLRPQSITPPSIPSTLTAYLRRRSPTGSGWCGLKEGLFPVHPHAGWH